MKLKNPRIERLKELMSLEERRSHLQSELDTLMVRMTNLKDALFEEGQHYSSETGNSANEKPMGTLVRRAGESNGRMRRGALRDQILTALEAGGTNGIKVTDLAAAIGIKPVNVYSWFHSGLKRYPQIKKLDGGHYRLEGKVDREANASSPGPVVRPATREGRRRTPLVQRSRRGELTQKIVDELGRAGAKGISVQDLAAKVGAPYKNIYIWFATTGKKLGKIEKVTPGCYRLGD